MDEQKKAPYVLDFGRIIQILSSNKKLFYRILPVVFVLSCIWIFPEPRYYNSEVVLAPELSSEDSPAGSLSSLASSFGINIGGAANDAIYPMLYPDLFESPEFIVSLFSIRIKVEDEDLGLIDTDYYTYLSKYKKKNWLTYPLKAAIKGLKRLIIPEKSGEAGVGDITKLNSFQLSRRDYELVKMVPKLVTCSVDKKTDVTTIVVQDQNRVVSALLADSIKVRLQDFITEYRTAKARKDVAYYQELTDSAKQEYDEVVAEYARYSDKHQNMILQSYISERDALENKMALKYETYTTLVAQLTAAKAKVQERTPAFTTLKSATVPIKPAGPKRMFFVLGMLVLASFVISIYALRHEIIR